MDTLVILREKLQALSKFHQLEVLRLLNKEKVEYTENRNGIFVNMNNLPEESIAALNDYLNYVSTQQDQLESIEKKKEEYDIYFLQKFSKIKIIFP